METITDSEVRSSSLDNDNADCEWWNDARRAERSGAELEQAAATATATVCTTASPACAASCASAYSRVGYTTPSAIRVHAPISIPAAHSGPNLALGLDGPGNLSAADCECDSTELPV